MQRAYQQRDFRSIVYLPGGALLLSRFRLEMIAIPALDVGAVPRGNPTEAVRFLADLGFTRFHLEDFGSPSRSSANLQAIEQILRETDAEIQVVGPSSGSEIERLFRTGAEYIVVGDRSIDEPEWLDGLSDLYPESLVVRTDLRDRRVVRRGWVRTLPVDVLDLVDDLSELPLAGILLSGLQLNAASRHADLALVEDLVDRSRNAIIVSAKVESANDLRALEHRGATAVVLQQNALLAGALDARSIAHEFGS